MKEIRINHCYSCGGQLVLKTVDRNKRYACLTCGTITYLNSKPCVGALIINNKEILLTLRRNEPFKGFWDIPGGFLEYGEHPESGLYREIKEELSLEVRIDSLQGIYMDEYGENGYSTLNIFYLCSPFGEPEFCSDEIVEYRWFAFDQLPNNIAFNSAKKVLKKLQSVMLNSSEKEPQNLSREGEAHMDKEFEDYDRLYPRE